MMIATRLLILLALLGVSVVAFYAWRWLSDRRFRRVAGHALPASIRGLIAAGQPAFLYFTTAECSQCRFRQSPILAQIRQQLGVNIVTVDAAEQPEVADFFGVMTVPSTVLLDRELRAVAINHGLATAPHLQQQLSAISP